MLFGSVYLLTFMLFRFVKYYKSLFLGFIDMALVNAYIVYTSTCK
jgi:hypothetical protein